MAWELIESITLAGTSDTLATQAFTGSDYPALQITVFIPEGNSTHGYIYFNDDTGANYARTGNIEGTHITTAPDSEINLTHDTDSTKYATLFFTNISGVEKLGVGEYEDNGGNGVGNGPNGIVWWYKSTDTSTPINKVTLFNQKTGTDFPVGTYLNVFGDKQ